MTAFFPRQMIVANFLRGIVGGPADPELDVRRIVVKSVDLVVEAVVFTVGTFRAHRIGFEAGMLNRIVIALLGGPFEIVAKIVHLDLGPLEVLVVGRQVCRDIVQFEPVLLDQLLDRNAAQRHLRHVLKSKEGLIAQGPLVIGDRVSVFGLVLPIEHQGNFITEGELRRKIFLPENEGLKRMEQILDGKSGQEPVRTAVRFEGDIVKASDLDPIAEVL